MKYIHTKATRDIKAEKYMHQFDDMPRVQRTMQLLNALSNDKVSLRQLDNFLFKYP